MKYYVEEDGQTIEIDIEDHGSSLLVRIGGQEMLVDLSKVTEPSLFSLIIDNRSYEIFVEEQEDHHNVLIAGELHRLKVQDEWGRRLANIQRKGLIYQGDLLVKAPMPGAVLALDVSEGDRVEERQSLVVLGAMKMENEIKAPRAGTVKSVNVQHGQTVQQGHVLLVLS